MDRQHKLLIMKSLGETVIFTENQNTFCAATIVVVHTETKVDLEVKFRDGTTKIETEVEYEEMGDKPRTWTRRIKT